jgi:hypothetical protein
LENNVINNILFTLKNTESPTGDGYDSEERCIVINTVTPLSVLQLLLQNDVKPGTAEYAKTFSGLTFLVPAGEGEIIIESQEANSYCLMVQIGMTNPISIYQTERKEYEIPYASDDETYVYVWNGGTDVVAAARSQTNRKGKKTAGNVKVYTVTYKAKSSASGIERVGLDDNAEEKWYDLNGRRVTKPLKKGLYINNGRKVVIK